MMDDPSRVRYAKAGTLNIAYRVWGEGPLDVVWVPGLASNLEIEREIPALELERRGDLVERYLEIREHDFPKPARLQLQSRITDDKRRKRKCRVQPSSEVGRHVHSSHELGCLRHGPIFVQTDPGV